LRAVATCAAKAVDRPRAQVIAEAELTLADHSSLKAALDIDFSCARVASPDRRATVDDLSRRRGECVGRPWWASTDQVTLR
jgi:hypothetical protein